MSLTARIKNNAVEIFDVQTGGIQRTHSLPPGSYSGIVVVGDNVSVTIKTQYGGDKIRTINMKTGGVVSELNM
tara:strand:+ start:756 stop:974 length:219 start_codon:yes stop_codon:yes gene_type:complete